MPEALDMSKTSNTMRALLLAALVAMPALAVGPQGPAPVFQLTSMDGKPVSLDQFKGQVVMINFWATWCGPCRQEMPLLDQLYTKYKPMGFTLLGVNVEPDSTLASGFLKKTPVTFPILFDTKSEVSKLYQVAGMPSTAIVDRKGNLRWVHKGYKPGDENEYLNQIRALVRE
jgi:thiol-disulfide isomerase/thioredoxin